jgi:predicted site-specific integrase-resolvase
LTRSDLAHDLLGCDGLMTVAEVAALLRVKAKTASRWAKDGLVPATPDGLPGAFKMPGGHWRYRMSVVRGMATGTVEIPEG